MCKDMNFIKQVMTKESNLDENIVQKYSLLSLLDDFATLIDDIFIMFNKFKVTLRL